MNENKTITIAVLPFDNLSDGNEMEIFCRSFCIDLITELSFFRQFHILAYQSVKNLGEKPESLREKLSALNVDYFVQGSFRNLPQQIRISAQLFDGHDNRLVWGNRLEGKLDELIHIQENLLKEIVASLQHQLNYDLLRQIKQKTNVPLKAYEYWLNGVDELKKGSVTHDAKARSYFKQALEIEPEYSLAFSGMSLTYFNEWSCQLWDRWEVSQNGAYDWAQQAIAIDEQNYIAAFILGRVFLYEGAYESAEYYLRKSLLLNSNDPESLIQIASCMVYLGYGKEALELYDKTLLLNPINAEHYNQIGAFIYFELSEYAKAMELAVKTRTRRWVDTDAFYAATYFHLGDFEQMKKYWQDFLHAFKEKINNGKETSDHEAVEWMMNVNPYKDTTNLTPFWEHITNYHRKEPALNETSRRANGNPGNTFEKKSDLWECSFDGINNYLPEVKGFHDIHKLIMNPGQSFHCTELMDSILVEEGTPTIDTVAKRQYHTKIKDLQTEIAEAEDFNDYAKSARLQEEYDAIISHLSKSLGLKGVPRKEGNTVEKARSAITWRIRSAISKIEKVNAPLGKHLTNSIKTGTFCAYMPEQEFPWNT